MLPIEDQLRLYADLWDNHSNLLENITNINQSLREVVRDSNRRLRAVQRVINRNIQTDAGNHLRERINGRIIQILIVTLLYMMNGTTRVKPTN